MEGGVARNDGWAAAAAAAAKKSADTQNGPIMGYKWCVKLRAFATTAKAIYSIHLCF